MGQIEEMTSKSLKNRDTEFQPVCNNMEKLDEVYSFILSQCHLVYSGNYSARVNNWDNDYHVSAIAQTVASYNDPNIYFAWAAVIEESHGTTDSDYFGLQLTDDTAGTTLYSVAYSSANTPAYFHQYGWWYYSDWQVVQLDVSAIQGHQITLKLIGSDCPYSGHGGYVYLDGFGAAPPPPGPIPEPSTFLLIGVGLVGAGLLRKRFKK
jgi:hypothetical protein